MRYLLKILLNIVRFLLRLLPDTFRKFLRNQHALMDVYSKALFESRMFFGAPSPKKEIRRYKKLLLNQAKDLASYQKLDKSHRVDVIVLIVEGFEHPKELISFLDKNRNVRDIYFISAFSLNEAISSHPSLSIKTDIADLGTDLPIILIRSQDLPDDNAINTMYLHALEKSQDAQSSVIVSCDIDVLDNRLQSYLPTCYPQWNPDLQLSTGYLKTGLFVKGRKLLEDLGSFLQHNSNSDSFSLWLCHLYLNKALFEIYHLPYSLVHTKGKKSTQWFQSLNNFVQHSAKGVIDIIKSDVDTDSAIIKWKHDYESLVSIIIPTYNAKDLVKICVESIINISTYKQFEIIIVDNNSDEKESIAYFEFLSQKYPEVTVIKYPKPFNYSAINNFAVDYCKGEIFAFVNNDIEVIEPKWLEYMVSHVLRSDIGCVGAKLLYPNKRVQHAGVVLGYGGGAGHAHKFFPDYHNGYMNRLSSTNNYSAVTAACMLVKRSDFHEVGGFDEVNLKIAFNDVDFCLKVASTGKRNLYCAEAVLFHHESISRGTENTPEKRKRFESEVKFLQSKWASYIDHDPCYSPNLTKRHENFALKE